MVPRPAEPIGQGGNLCVPGNLEVTGDIAVTGRLIGSRAKIGFVADQFVNAHGDALEVGDVVAISEDQSALAHGLGDAIPVPEVDLARDPYDTRVCGIVCEVYGELVDPRELRAGGRPRRGSGKQRRRAKPARVVPRAFTAQERVELGAGEVPPGHVGTMVTLGAYAHCKVDAGPGGIAVGDLLTTSATAGHAQKVLEPERAVGAILGKALARRQRGTGKIPVLVMLQ